MDPDNFDTKLRFLATQIAWIVAMMVIMPICFAGIYIGTQYFDDKCVRQTSYTIALDWWLIIACIYDIIFWIIIMILLCCKARQTCRRVMMWPLNIINVIWMGIGIWLLIEGQIRCQHNTLWVMSLVVISITLTLAVSIVIVLGCSHLGVCSKLAKCLSFEDKPYYMPIATDPEMESWE